MLRFNPRRLAVAFGLLSGLATGRQAAAEGLSLAHSLSHRFSELADQSRFSGELLVDVGGEVVIHEWFGSVARPGAAGPSNIYPIASVTKAVTAVGVLGLAARGRLSLTDPVSRFFPEIDPSMLARDGRAVTLDDLLGHRSGLADMQIVPARVRAHPSDVAVMMLRQSHLASRPGEQRIYSNEGYVLLGEVIRRVSGQPYDLFIDREFVQPLGLRDTGIELDSEQRQRLVPGLLGSLVGLREARSLIPHRLRYEETWPGAADGGLHASAMDLRRLFRALLDGTLLPPVWLSMFTDPPKGLTRGLIVTPLEPSGRRRILWHNGATPESGYQAFVGFLTDQMMTIVVLAIVDDSAVNVTDVVLDEVEGVPPKLMNRWTVGLVINTAHALRLGWLGALVGIGLLGWCLKVPRKSRAEDLGCIASAVMLVTASLIEASNWMLIVACLAATVLTVLILRRPPLRPWRRADRKGLGAMLSLAAAGLVITGVLVLRALS